MKVSCLLPLLLSSVALAAQGRRSHSALSARQAQMKRGLVDVCAALDLDVKLLDILPGGKPLIAGHLDLCLCLSVLPNFVKSNSVAQNVANLLGGADNAHDFFTNLINNQSDKQTCHYPEHAHGICNVKNPCDWECEDGYKPDNAQNPTKCVCPAPFTECNGQCGNFPHGCSSQAASHKKRAPTCSANKTLCGVAGGSKGKGYDCVDTQKDLESCGGCVVASPFDQSAVATGKDCSSLPNVSAVRCVSGACAVSACEDGFTVSTSGDSCVAIVKREEQLDVLNDILDLLVKQGLLANVGGLVGAKEGLLAGLHIARDANIDQLDQVITVLLNKGVLVGVNTVGDVWAKIGAVANINSVGALLNACLAQGLVAQVGNLLGIKEGLLAGVHILRDVNNFDEVINSLLSQGLLVGVKTVGDVWAKLAVVGHIDSVDALLNALLAQGLLVKVGNLAGLKEGLLAGIHVARRDLNNEQVDSIITALLNGGLLVGVKTLGDVWAKIGAVAHINSFDALLNALVAQGLVANVGNILGMKEGLLAGIHVLRRQNVVRDGDLLNAGVVQGLVAEVGGLVAAADRLGAGVSVL